MLRCAAIIATVAMALGGGAWRYDQPFDAAACLFMGAMVLWFICGDMRFDEIAACDAKKADAERRDWELNT